jgi:hypothetical protein
VSTHPKYCCQSCGEAIGYLRVWFEVIFGTTHQCAPIWRRPETVAERSARINESGRKAMRAQEGPKP